MPCPVPSHRSATSMPSAWWRGDSRHRGRPGPTLWVVCLSGLCLLTACSGNDEPTTLPSQTVSQVTPQLEPPPPLPPPDVREVRPRQTSRSTVKVIDDGGSTEGPDSLAEASRLAKSQKGTRGPSVVEITDENLHEYAEKGEIIVLESAPAAPNPQEAVVEPEDGILAQEPTGPRDEQYWRGRALELRMGWRRTVDRIKELELEAAALRQQFYAEDDPYIRDGQLKPAWDRVLDRTLQLQQRADQYERELEVFIEDGRRAQAHQGWLNQGWELEPTTEEITWKKAGATAGDTDQLPNHDAIDPETTDEVYDP